MNGRERGEIPSTIGCMAETHLEDILWNVEQEFGSRIPLPGQILVDIDEQLREDLDLMLEAEQCALGVKTMLGGLHEPVNLDKKTVNDKNASETARALFVN